MKDSFILYNAFYEPIKEMKNEQLGKLLRAIFDYTTTGKITQEPDIMIAFMFIKNQIDIDQKKWQDIKKVRSEAGKKHKGNQYTNGTKWNKMEQTEQNGTNGTVNENDNVNENVNVNVNVNENENVNVKDNILYIVEQVVLYLNLKTHKHFKKSSTKTRNLIKARLNEGYEPEDFKIVIDKKTKEWLNDDRMNTYLRPETLFGTKFESYLNQKEKKLTTNDLPKIDWSDF